LSGRKYVNCVSRSLWLLNSTATCTRDHTRHGTAQHVSAVQAQ
jgi:hypothetical protein